MWMITELGLKGSELIIYAVIFGFSQDGSTMYTGSAQYLADWTNTTKQSVFKVLKSLTDRKLIIRHEETRNGVMFVSYSYNPDALVTGDKQSLLGWSTKFTGVVNKVDGGSKQSLPNNIEDKLEYNKDYKLEETRVSKDTLPKEKSGKSAKTGPFDEVYANFIAERFSTFEDTSSLQDAVKDFIDHRADIKKKLTPTALKLNLEKAYRLAEGDYDRTCELILNAVANGWQGIYDDSSYSRHSQSSQFSQGRTMSPDLRYSNDECRKRLETEELPF